MFDLVSLILLGWLLPTSILMLLVIRARMRHGVDEIAT